MKKTKWFDEIYKQQNRKTCVTLPYSGIKKILENSYIEARKLGYDFTDEEFNEDCTNSKKLNDEELANVSGGYLWLVLRKFP